MTTRYDLMVIGAAWPVSHTDLEAQHTSWVFGHRLRAAGLLRSMERVASSADNTMIESFWSTMRRELPDTAPGPRGPRWPQ